MTSSDSSVARARETPLQYPASNAAKIKYLHAFNCVSLRKVVTSRRLDAANNIIIVCYSINRYHKILANIL